ncbi:MAG: hypothetical protein II851_04590 [Bacteroidales bacterium]|nr:hypothetical protein [Bacteroidales bacterium]
MRIRGFCKRSLAVLLPALMLFASCRRDAVPALENGRVRLAFDAATGWPASMTDQASGEEMLEDCVPLWEIRDRQDSLINEETSFLGCRRQSDGLQLSWKTASGIRVKALARLAPEDSLLHWSLSVTGLDPGSSVRYPILDFKKLENEDFAFGSWLGRIERDPRTGLGSDKPLIRFNAESPGALSLQLIAAYDRESERGLYLTSNDSLSFTKTFTVELDSAKTRFYLTHYPALEGPSKDWNPGYEVITGPFRGDWMTAAQLYRRWAVEQRWCRESLLAQQRIEDWALGTGLWVWNRGRSENVLPEALHLQETSGLPVSVLWHWWCNCGHDDDFPYYLPPREGADLFRDAVRSASDQGVHALVYMNSFEWGTSTPEWEEAKPFALKRQDGSFREYTSNKFTGHTIAAMCLHNDFWTDRYVAMADTVLREYGIGGIYMDEACTNLRCYDPSHGHSIGGGNYWVEDFNGLASRIRSQAGRTVLAGEGSGEDWIPSLDLFLTLGVSRERYIGGDAEPIPLFQAVYHDYAITFGSYSSLVYPPFDERWKVELKPEGCETLLPERFNLQFRMEQARALVYGMQPSIANYHAFLDEARSREMGFALLLARTRMRYLDYLLYGRMERVPSMTVPTAQADISKVSIYARDGQSAARITKEIPLLYTGMWRSPEGGLALFIVNIGEEILPVDFALDPALYGLPASCQACMDGETIARASEGTLNVSTTLPGRSIRVITFL